MISRMATFMRQIEREVSLWEGVAAVPHRFGGVEFNLGRAEIGHVHQNGLVDIPFTMALRNQLLSEGLASEHHVLPNSGWVSFRIKTEADVQRATWLLRLSYLRYVLRPRDHSNSLTEKTADAALAQLHDLHLSPELARALMGYGTEATPDQAHSKSPGPR
jgi:hypothetical protein